MRRVEKSIKISQGAKLLLSSGYYTEASILYWISIRELIFHILFFTKIEYESTREALKKFITAFRNDEQLVCDILTLERLSTLVEWDEFLQVSPTYIDKIVELHFSAFNQLKPYVQN